MSVYSTNQVRHLYVVTSEGDVNAPNAAVGTIAVVTDDDKNHLYFEYKGHGGVTRSDLIDLKNVLYTKVTDAEKLNRKLKVVEVTLNGDVNGGAPVGGQDYILKIAIRQFVGMSDDDIYTKFGMVHATSGMNTSDFYKELAISLAKNFSRDTTPLFSFHLKSAAGALTEVTALTTKESLKDQTFNAVVIKEVEQPWTLGIHPSVPVYFDVVSGTIVADSEEVVWGEAKEIDSNVTVNNGKNIADLEYFCMGERGDQYRGIGWPNNIVTKYVADPTKAYHVLDIHYAYVGANESVQKSEKTITLVCDNKDTLTTIAGKFN